MNNHLYDIIKSDKMVLDIETDGSNAILQIAYIMYDSDNNIIASKNFYVYDGIHSKPFYENTISEQDIIKYGIPPKEASYIVTQDINNTNIIIGHNIKSFDLTKINILNSNFNNKIKDNLIIHDTMIESRNIVNAKNKFGKPKFPRLEELNEFLGNKKIENYHDALGDVTVTFECYKQLCTSYNCFKTI